MKFVIGHIARYAPSSKFQNQQKYRSKLLNLFFHHYLIMVQLLLLPSPTTSFSFSVFSKFFLLPFDFLEALGVFNAAALFFKNIDGRLAGDVKGMACRMGN